jgi:hypothetical protein
MRPIPCQNWTCVFNQPATCSNYCLSEDISIDSTGRCRSYCPDKIKIAKENEFSRYLEEIYKDESSSD